MSKEQEIEPQATRVILKVRAEVEMGKSVYVIGSTPTLGCWNPARAIPLVTTPSSYPVWHNAEAIAIPTGETFAYKYLIFSGGKFERWEDFDGDRIITASLRSLRIHDTLHHREANKVEYSEELVGPRSHSAASLAADADDESQLESSDSLIIVSFKLPVNLTREVSEADGAVSWRAEWDEDSLLSRKRATGADAMRILWVGLPGVEVSEEEQDAVSTALLPFRCRAVFMPAELQRAMAAFCVDSLWPAFHNIIDIFGERPTRWWNPQEQVDAWTTYTTVNRLVAQAVVEQYHEGQLIWVQDYQLLLLPSFISRRLRTANIGLFLHTPFPSSEVFCSLSMRHELLRGMLCAEQIGFHLFEYARHFLTCCRRLLGLAYDRKGGHILVNYQGRSVSVTSSHAGVEPQLILRRMYTPAVSRGMAELTDRVGDRIVAAGVDTMHRVSGLPLKLLAVERFLQDHPSMRGRFTLIQYATSRGISLSSDSPASRSLHSVRATAARVNARDPPGATCPSVILFEVEAVPLTTRIALWGIADIMLCTSIREGLNTLHHEFVLVQRAMKGLTFSTVGTVDSLVAYPRRRHSTAGSATAVGDVSSGTLPVVARRHSRSSSSVGGGGGEQEQQQSPRHPYTLFRSSSWLGGGRTVSAEEVARSEATRSSRSSSDNSNGDDGSAEQRSNAVARCEAEFKAIRGRRFDPSGGGVTRRLTPGLVILSEFSASSRVLHGALAVNPWSLGDVIAALRRAMGMNASERRVRSGQDGAYVCNNTTSDWAEHMVMDLKRSRKRSSEFSYTGYGLGLGFKVMGVKHGFRQLPTDRVIQAYRSAVRRLILLDVHGTLIPDQGKSGAHSRRRVPLQVLVLLRSLCADSRRNSVFVVSRMDHRKLDSLFRVDGLGLAAEHGYYYRWGSNNRHSTSSPLRKLSRGGVGRRRRSNGGGSSAVSSAVSSAMSSANATSGDGSGDSGGGTTTDWGSGGGGGGGGGGTTYGEGSSSGSRSRSRVGSEDSATGNSNNGSNGNSSRGRSRSGSGNGNGGSGSSGGGGGNWELLGEHLDESWKELVMNYMSMYVQRTNGTYMESRGSAVLWHFGDADPDFGQLQAKELHDHLESVLVHFPVEVVRGTDYVETRPKGVNKGVFVNTILNAMEGTNRAAGVAAAMGGQSIDKHAFSALPDQGSAAGAAAASAAATAAAERAGLAVGPLDFVLSIGDDGSDDTMFAALHEREERQMKEGLLNPPSIFTCTVGQQPSNAKYFLNGTEDVLALLSTLAKISNRVRHSRSDTDLAWLAAATSPRQRSAGGGRGGGGGGGGFGFGIGGLPTIPAMGPAAAAAAAAAAQQQREGGGESGSEGGSGGSQDEGSDLLTPLRGPASPVTAAAAAFGRRTQSVGVLQSMSAAADGGAGGGGAFPAGQNGGGGRMISSTIDEYFDKFGEEEEEEDGIFF